MEAKLYGQNKGGTSINGIIKDYYAYAGENISAGDLVEYVNGVASKTVIGTTEDIQLSTESYTAGNMISAVALDENRVFIAHSYTSTYYLYGIVVTINGANISFGTDTQLSTAKYSGRYLKAILLNNGNVFIAHATTSSNYVCAVICSVSGTAITAGSPYSTNSISDTANTSITPIQLSDNAVYILHNGSSNNTLYGTTVEFSGTKITNHYGNSQISTVKCSGFNIKAEVLPNDNVFVVCSNSTDYYMQGMLFHKTSTKLVLDAERTLSSVAYSGKIMSTCLLPDGNVFIAHSRGSNYDLYGMIVDMTETVLTVKSDIELLAGMGTTSYSTSVCPVSDNKLFLTYGFGSNNYLHGMILNIEDGIITSGIDTSLNGVSKTGSHISSIALNDRILVSHSSTTSYYLHTQLFGIDYFNNIPTNEIATTELETQVRQVTTGQFDGIAKTSGEGGDDTGHKDIVSIWTKE